VAVIGPRWANADNLPRLHDENDMVRYELVSALASELTIVPTLVEGAEIPKAAALPIVLQPLFDVWNARPINESGWQDDIRRLIAEIAQAAGLSARPDLETLIRDAAAAQQYVAELQQTLHLQTDQIDALRRTVDELTRKLAEARPGFAAALTALAQGNSLAVEDAFEREYEAESRAAEQARHAAAQAARNVANLALLRDVSKAVSFYRKALAIEPEHAETTRLIGHALILLGDLEGAEAALSRSLSAAIVQGDAWGEMAGHLGLGEIFHRRWKLVAAHEAFMIALRLGEQWLATHAGDIKWQFALLISQVGIGDVLVKQSDGRGALAAYRRSLTVAEMLATHDPANIEWQHHLMTGQERIGTLLMALGGRRGALSAYRKNLDIAEALAARNRSNTTFQRDLWVSHNKIGDVLETQHRWPQALIHYRKSLAIIEALVASDSANKEWQRDLSITLVRIGDVLMMQSDWSGALIPYRKNLDIAQALAERDPTNAEWQRDLSLSYDKIGDGLVKQGDGPEALDAYLKSLAIREKLTALDPSNTLCQTDVAISSKNLAKEGLGQSLEIRRSYLLQGIEILMKLKAAGRLLPKQDWLDWFRKELAKLSSDQP
jgi:tetratricopeptide (TPR) repeat protein